MKIIIFIFILYETISNLKIDNLKASLEPKISKFANSSKAKYVLAFQSPKAICEIQPCSESTRSELKSNK